MTRRVSRALVLVVLALLALSAAPARAAAPSVTRVLVVGDSISQGFGGDWTWRYWLWRELQRQAVPVDLVGPTRGPAYGARYERSWAWDSDHAARSGSTVDDHAPAMAERLSTYRPDVLVVELGINDIRAGDSPETVAAQLIALLQSAQAQRPAMRIVVAELPNTGSAEQDQKTAQVNALVAAWSVGTGVTVAHNRTGEGTAAPAWDPAQHTYDSLHPNATGQTLLAYRIAQALVRAGVLTRASPQMYQVRAWSPDARPDVTAARGGVVVRWMSATHEIKLQSIRVLVDGSARTGWLAASGATTGVRLAVPPGDHRVQLVPRRGSMTGTPSGAVLVHVS